VFRKDREQGGLRRPGRGSRVGKSNGDPKKKLRYGGVPLLEGNTIGGVLVGEVGRSDARAGKVTKGRKPFWETKVRAT